MKIPTAACVLAAAWMCVPAGGQQAQPETLPQQAAKLYETANSRYREGKWAEARPLLEKFVKAYATNERIPTAYIQLATCCQRLGDDGAFAAALEAVLGRFAGSIAWFQAADAKLDRARKGKDPDEYLKIFETYSRQLAELPWNLESAVDYYGRHWYYWHTDLGELADLYFPRGWILTVATVADTPERAQRVLAAMAKTLRQRAKELPADWQFAHVRLLRQAGEADQAEKALAGYIQAWGDDPQGIGLLLLGAEEAERQKDAPAAEAAWKHLLETWLGCESLATPLRVRLDALYRAGDYDGFVAAVGPYLKTYTTSGYQSTVIGQWVHLAIRHAGTTKDDAPLLATLKELEELAKIPHPEWYRVNLRHRVQLLNALKRYEDGARLAEELFSDEHWCAASFDQICTYAQNHEAYRKVVAAARQKRSIPLSDPTSKAFGLLNQLKVRLKDDQVRHAEELGEELYTQHTNQDAAIEGLKCLADYYFKKVLPEPRDKWMDRMIKTYPLHPLTEAVLGNRVTAEHAAQRHDRLAVALDTAFERFPPTRYDRYWYQYRVKCFEVKKDFTGRLEWVRKHMGARAAAGEIYAIDQIALYERETFEDNVAFGDSWVAKAEKVPNTRLRLYFLCEAMRAYYLQPWHKSPRGAVEWVKAGKVIGQLLEQKFDPELAWKTGFADVTLLAREGKAAEALALLNKKLPAKKVHYDLSRRLSLSDLGAALGKAGMLRDGPVLAKRLAPLVVTRRDQAWLELMLASMYLAVDHRAAAAGHYLNIAHMEYPPARGYWAFSTAISHLQHGKGDPRQVPAEMDRYMKKIAQVQDLYPDLLYRLAAFYLSHRSGLAMGVRGDLISRYPASTARDLLDAAIARYAARPG